MTKTKFQIQYKNKYLILFYFRRLPDTNTNTFFFIIFCVIENFSINKYSQKCHEFYLQIGLPGITQISTTKNFKSIHQKIKDKMHVYWKHILISIEINSEL